MKPSPLVFDGLRRCLCPGVTRASWLASLGATTATTQRPSRTRQHPALIRHLRPYSVLTSSASSPTEDVTSFLSEEAALSVPEMLQSAPFSTEDLHRLGSTKTEDIQEAITILRQFDATTPCDVPHQHVLRRLMQLTNHLVTNRDMGRSEFVYESLVDAMAHPGGSSHGLLEILKDMNKTGLEWTETVCRSALRALTVHPHYTLQVVILDVMRANWYQFESSDVQNVILGLLRDEQYDLAYVRLMEMGQAGAAPELWMLDIMAMVLGYARHYDEMLEVCELRGKRSSDDGGYVNLVYQLLDSCSTGFHYNGTAAAWEMGVVAGLFKPSDGILQNVLFTAANHGDPELAGAAYDELAGRTRVNDEQHYALLESFLNAKDVPRAIEFISIMEGLGIHEPALHEMSRRFRAHAYYNQNALKEATTMIKALAAEDKFVTHGLAAVIKAMAASQGGESAAELFDEVPRLSGQQPDCATLTYMIMYTKDMDLRRTYAQQYRDQTSAGGTELPMHKRKYHDLIMSCVEMNDLELAVHFALQYLRGPVHNKEIGWLSVLLEYQWRQGGDRMLELYDRVQDKGNRAVKEHTRRLLLNVQKKVERDKEAAEHGHEEGVSLVDAKADQGGEAGRNTMAREEDNLSASRLEDTMRTSRRLD